MNDYKKYASARDRTTDLMIFSHTLSQLSYKGSHYPSQGWLLISHREATGGDVQVKGIRAEGRKVGKYG